MYGAILGDICGSIFEWENCKTITPQEIPLVNSRCEFTDDSVMTIATAAAILGDCDYRQQYLTWGRAFPCAGYGGRFSCWLADENPRPYNSWGNGSAMRVSPIGWAFPTLDQTLSEAKRSAECTHNHPEGINGAQSAAAAIFLARKGESKRAIKAYVEKTFGYDLGGSIAAIRPDYEFDVSCQGSMPVALLAFLESTDFADALQIAISVGGDSDTIACITGGIAEAFYGKIPEPLLDFASEKLDSTMLPVIDQFRLRYCKRYNTVYGDPSCR